MTRTRFLKNKQTTNKNKKTKTFLPWISPLLVNQWATPRKERVRELNYDLNIYHNSLSAKRNPQKIRLESQQMSFSFQSEIPFPHSFSKSQLTLRVCGSLSHKKTLMCLSAGCAVVERAPDNPETAGPLFLQGNVLVTPTTSELSLPSSPSTGRNAWKSQCRRVHYEENAICLPSLPPTSSKLVSLIMLYILYTLSGKIHCKCIWLNKYMVNKHFSCPFYW